MPGSCMKRAPAESSTRAHIFVRGNSTSRQSAVPAAWVPEEWVLQVALAVQVVQVVRVL